MTVPIDVQVYLSLEDRAVLSRLMIVLLHHLIKVVLLCYCALNLMRLSRELHTGCRAIVTKLSLSSKEYRRRMTVETEPFGVFASMYRVYSEVPASVLVSSS